MADLSDRNPASARTSHDSCHLQEQNKRDTMYNPKKLLYNFEIQSNPNITPLFGQCSLWWYIEDGGTKQRRV
jgi:hypothetical protein